MIVFFLLLNIQVSQACNNQGYVPYYPNQVNSQRGFNSFSPRAFVPQAYQGALPSSFPPPYNAYPQNNFAPSRFNNRSGSGSYKQARRCSQRYETADTVVIHIEIPGIKPENILVEIEGNRLKYKNQTSKKVTQAGENSRYSFNSSSSVSKSMMLPPYVDTEDYTKNIKDNQLELVFKKK